MPVVRKKVVAIACSDLHLSLKPPVARAGEEDWLGAQSRPLEQLQKLAEEYKAPILCAGDVFDRWNSPVELVNWAIDHLPHMYAIPGQHDLPLHRLDMLQKSAYWTMTRFDETMGLYHLVTGDSWGIRDISVQAFPWGVPLTPPAEKKGRLNIALLHQYVWIPGAEYPGAPREAGLSSLNVKGWDVVIIGDNHKGFLTEKDGTVIFNCGSLMRRKSDEINYKPQVGLIFSDGTVEPHYLDCSDDIITETAAGREPKDDMELKEFLEELTKLQNSQLDFEEAMKHVLDEKACRPAVRELILKAMGGSQ